MGLQKHPWDIKFCLQAPPRHTGFPCKTSWDRQMVTLLTPQDRQIFTADLPKTDTILFCLGGEAMPLGDVGGSMLLVWLVECNMTLYIIARQEL